MTLPDLTLTGARVLTPDGLTDTAVAVAAGRIAAGRGGAWTCRGYLILPGIVDIHGDGFERHLAPRAGRWRASRRAWEPRRGACGERHHHRRDRAVLVLGRRDARPGLRRGAGRCAAGTPMRAETLVQLRLEIGMIDDFDRVLALVERGRIRYVVLNDHLPHKELAAGKRPPSLTGQALKARRSPEAHHAMLQAMHDRWDEVPGALERLCAG
jgi:alpha-D-ribose 1-methylphosphonate 5-triphosphate diphosphatase